MCTGKICVSKRCHNKSPYKENYPTSPKSTFAVINFYHRLQYIDQRLVEFIFSFVFYTAVIYLLL